MLLNSWYVSRDMWVRKVSNSASNLQGHSRALHIEGEVWYLRLFCYCYNYIVPLIPRLVGVVVEPGECSVQYRVFHVSSSSPVLWSSLWTSSDDRIDQQYSLSCVTEPDVRRNSGSSKEVTWTLRGRLSMSSMLCGVQE